MAGAIQPNPAFAPIPTSAQHRLKHTPPARRAPSSTASRKRTSARPARTQNSSPTAFLFCPVLLPPLYFLTSLALASKRRREGEVRKRATRGGGGRTRQNTGQLFVCIFAPGEEANEGPPHHRGFADTRGTGSSEHPADMRSAQRVLGVRLGEGGPMAQHSESIRGVIREELEERLRSVVSSSRTRYPRRPSSSRSAMRVCVPRYDVESSCCHTWVPSRCSRFGSCAGG